MNLEEELKAQKEKMEAALASFRAEIKSLRGDVALIRAENPRKLNPLSMEQVQELLASSSVEHTTVIDASPDDPGRFKRRSTVIVCPTRGNIDSQVVEAWMGMTKPMNTTVVGPIFARNFEVARAYNRLVDHVIHQPVLSTWEYLLSVEDDNIPPPDALLRLIDAMERARTEDGKPYDAIAGLYHIKNSLHQVMAYGSGRDYRRTGEENCRVLGLNEIQEQTKDGVVEVLGIPMGCTIYRMKLFREIEPPWFATLEDDVLIDIAGDGNSTVVPYSKLAKTPHTTKAHRCMTQDLFFCVKSIRKGKRFGILTDLRVGHLDVSDGMVY